MTDSDRVAAYLAEVKADLTDGAVYPHRVMEWHAPRLVNAVGAVLEMHRISDQGPPGEELHCVRCSLATGWARLVPPDGCDVRAAISRALLGEGEAGG